MEKKDIIQSFKDSLFTGLIALSFVWSLLWDLRTASKGEGFIYYSSVGYSFFISWTLYS
jgi:hypothetical protein